MGPMPDAGEPACRAPCSARLLRQGERPRHGRSPPARPCRLQTRRSPDTGRTRPSAKSPAVATESARERPLSQRRRRWSPQRPGGAAPGAVRAAGQAAPTGSAHGQVRAPSPATPGRTAARQPCTWPRGSIRPSSRRGTSGTGRSAGLGSAPGRLQRALPNSRPRAVRDAESRHNHDRAGSCLTLQHGAQRRLGPGGMAFDGTPADPHR
jgi:hypothetical protein